MTNLVREQCDTSGMAGLLPLLAFFLRLIRRFSLGSGAAV